MRPSNLVLVTVLVLGVLVKEAVPQGFQIDNNTIFTLGAVAVASGLAYHVGRQQGFNQGSGRPNQGGLFGLPFLGRRRRQASPQSPSNELDPLVLELFQMALKKDVNGCSLMLACTIGRNPSSTLTGHAKEFESTLSTSKESETDSKTSRHGLDSYRIALNLGRDGGDCEALFPECNNKPSQLMGAFQGMRVGQK